MNRSDARVVELDVRPHLRSKLEPFRLIMDTVKTLGSDDIFVLHATFKPTPLLGVMKMKGFAGKAEHVGEEHWKVTFVRKKNRHWLDEPGTSADAAEDAADRSPAAAKTLWTVLPPALRNGNGRTRGRANRERSGWTIAGWNPRSP